jgi:hypothetical protein
MNIDKRVDEIVGSLSVEKLIQFGIAHALSFDSYAEYSSAYCEHYEEISPYTSKVFWAFVKKIENRWCRTPQHTSSAVDDAFYRAWFLLALWGNCYQHVGDVNRKMLWRLRPLLDKLAAIAHGVPVSLDCGGDIKDLLAELLRAQAAVATIRDRHFGGQPIIFKEDDEKLNVLIAEAEELAQLYNIILNLSERAGAKKPQSEGGRGLPLKLDLANIKLVAKNSSAKEIRSLVAMAESTAHAALGHGKLATEILIAEFKGNQP